MRVVLPFVFLMFAVAGVFGLMMFNSAKNGDGLGGAKSNGFALALQMFTESTVDQLVPEQPVGALVTYLPQAPIGWTREAYQTAHGEALTEAIYQPSNVVISRTNTILSKFDSASRDVNGAAATYRKGEEVVAVSITARSERDMNSLQGSIMTAISGNLSTNAGFVHGNSSFGTLHGITFKPGSMTSRVMATGANVPVAYRTFNASMGAQIGIRILTNASDASIAEIMSGIDIPGLNQTLVTPDLKVTPGTGLITTELGPLSTTPPEPSLAYKAFNHLRTGVEGLTQDEIRLLQSIADGKIATWQHIYDELGLRHGLSDQMMAVLGPEPPLPPVEAVRVEAMNMIAGNTGVYGASDIAILTGLAQGNYETQAEAKRDLLPTALYAPPVLRLIGKLPEAPAGTDVAAVGSEDAGPREIVVRRGTEVKQGDAILGDCKIELGVRRCVVLEDGGE